jgi:hypothetical protein
MQNWTGMAIKGKALRKRRRCQGRPRFCPPDFEQLLLKISNDFVRAVAPDIEALIRKSVARLGKALTSGSDADPHHISSVMPGWLQ